MSNKCMFRFKPQIVHSFDLGLTCTPASANRWHEELFDTATRMQPSFSLTYWSRFPAILWGVSLWLVMILDVNRTADDDNHDDVARVEIETEVELDDRVDDVIDDDLLDDHVLLDGTVKVDVGDGGDVRVSDV